MIPLRCYYSIYLQPGVRLGTKSRLSSRIYQFTCLVGEHGIRLGVLVQTSLHLLTRWCKLPTKLVRSLPPSCFNPLHSIHKLHMHWRPETLHHAFSNSLVKGQNSWMQCLQSSKLFSVIKKHPMWLSPEMRPSGLTSYPSDAICKVNDALPLKWRSFKGQVIVVTEKKWKYSLLKPNSILVVICK